MRVIVPAPATVSTEPGSHVVHAIGHAGSIRVRFAFPQPHLPHGLYNSPQVKKKKKKKLVSPSPQNPNQTPHIAKTLEKSPEFKYQKRKKLNANETENSNAKSEMGRGTFEPDLAAGGDPLLLVLTRLGAISRLIATVQFHRNGVSFLLFYFRGSVQVTETIQERNGNVSTKTLHCS